MLKATTGVFVLLLTITLHAQEAPAPDSAVPPWKFKINTSLTANQTTFTNWAAGGQSAISATGLLNAEANYKNGVWGWYNSLTQVYGINRLSEDSFTRKLNDLFTLKSNVERNLNNYWKATVFTSLVTQLTPGYPTKQPPISYTSTFFAPAFLQEGVGFAYRDDSTGFSTIIAPLSFKHTIVLDPVLDEQMYGLDSLQRVRTELGGYVSLEYTQELFERISLAFSTLLFTNYLENPENIDINTRLELNLNATKYLTFSIIGQLIYDHDVLLPTLEDRDGDGIKEQVGEGPKAQIMQALGVGFSYKFKTP